MYNNSCEHGYVLGTCSLCVHEELGFLKKACEHGATGRCSACITKALKLLKSRAKEAVAEATGGAEEKAQRFNEGKPRLGLVLEFRRALEAAADGLEEGVEKYGRGDWKKGMEPMDVVDSLARHLVAFASGEFVDQKSGKLHVDKVLCNALMLAEYVHMDMEKKS